MCGPMHQLAVWDFGGGPHTRPRSLPSCLATPPQATKLRREMQESDRRKLKNRMAHSKPGAVKVTPARKRKIVEELE